MYLLIIVCIPLWYPLFQAKLLLHILVHPSRLCALVLYTNGSSRGAVS